MLKPRVIPTLLLKGNRLVKTIKFENPSYVGDPINVIRIFNEKEVDEILILDIEASKNQKEPDYEYIEKIAGECFMPLTYGGGINSLEQAKQIFALGVEKICLQTAALEKPELISDLASVFGSQSVVVSLDIKRSFVGNPKIWFSKKRETLLINWLDITQKWVEAGAGEFLLNAVDKDGTLGGPDLDLIRIASKAISVPLVFCGGVSSLQDIKKACEAGASAVAAGSFFIYHGPHRAVLITYPSYDELQRLFQK